MKRCLITLWSVCLVFLGSMAQKPITGFFNIPGHMKSSYSWRDEVGVKKGTPCVLQFVTRLKKPEPGEGSMQVAMAMDGKQFYIPLDVIDHYFEIESVDKNAYWNMILLDKYPESFWKDEFTALRHEQRLEADKYISELEKNKMFYNDAALEDYLQCLFLSVMPDGLLTARTVIPPVVRLLRSAAPDIVMLGNGHLLISTGMLAILDSEKELEALMLREVSHLVMDHALVTIKQNIARANRAAFWGAVADGVVAAAEQALYTRYDYYQPGLFFETNAVIQSYVNENIAKRMGLDYAPKLEWEADRMAVSYLVHRGESKEALASALHKLNDYYQRENDVSTLSKYGAYGTLEDRVKEWGEPALQTVDRNFLTKMRSVVSYEATMQDYNKQYRNARLLAMKNINNKLACADDYLMVARSIMKQTNTSESNAECLLYLDKADLVSETENVNITKMRILLMIRENMKLNAIDMLKKYQRQLDVMFRQPHTEEDAVWITEEHLWAQKLLEGMYLD